MTLGPVFGLTCDHGAMPDVGALRIPTRSTDDRVVAGVCGGIAGAIGLDPVLVRIAMIVLGVTGSGVPLYAVAWLVMAKQSDDEEADAPPTVDARRAFGLVLIVLGAVLTLRALGLTPRDAFVWPVVAVGIGVGVVFWQVQPQLESGRWAALRIGAGILVVGTGIAALIAGNVPLSVIRDSVLATVLVVGGLALIIGPWIAVLVRDRAEEHRQRVEADARADMAAHLHDSVLQTFALIQRTDDPKVISSLARQQERELRRWLYAEGDNPMAATLKTAVERVAAVVEDRHDISVQTVVVGDVDFDANVEALIGATGEAATNAAKWSGCDQVSVFVEVEDDGVRAFVRDTGVGFEPDAVAPDRLGVKESIIGRLERVGGTASVTSAPDEGTEVELFVPLQTGTRRDTV